MKKVKISNLAEKSENKKDKITFIMSYRHDEVRDNHPFFKHLYNEYLKMDNDELDIEFNYYYNLK